MTVGEGAAVDEPSPAPADDEAALIDHRRVMAEIQNEARRLRREGVVSPTFERELDVVFGRLAPPAASEDFDAALAAAEELAHVDAHVPVLSEKPGGSFLKRVVRKAVFFYGKHVTDQVTAFATTTARTVRLLARRVDALEEAVPASSRRVQQELTDTPPSGDGLRWADAIVDAFPAGAGRVVVGECGAGALVSTLADRGFDVYGVEPRSAAADRAAAAGLEVREDQVLDHLRLVPGGGLRGAVLIGCVDRLALGQQLALLDAAGHALAPGGALAVVTEGQVIGESPEEQVAADLAPGRPLHPPTWRHLLESNGFEGVRVVADDPVLFERLPAGGEIADVVNRNLERLERQLAISGAALVVGRRSAR